MALTLLTQLGGLAWAVALVFARGTLRRLVLFLAGYAVLWIGASFAAPQFGRVALPCFSSAEAALSFRSPLYCPLNRHYVVPELAAVTVDLAEHMDRVFPGTKTQALDAGFPFITGFPLLPHLSHDDGRKLDLAFYYRDEGGYAPGQTPSPIGYFAFEGAGADCPKVWPALRWDLVRAQSWWRDLDLDAPRQAEALRWLARDPRVEKVFVEPPLAEQLGVWGPKIRFQGCRAARHDDHLHFQIAP